MTSDQTDRVLGVDGAGKHGWAGVLLDSSGFVAAHLGSLSDLIQWAEPVSVVTVDIPIGLAPAGSARGADAAARQFIRPRASSVFSAPPAEVAAVNTYIEMNEYLEGVGASKLSKQTWALVPKILKVAEVAATDPRVIEVHPEVSFRALASEPLRWSKKSWNGLLLRRSLLARAGIALPDAMPELLDVVSDDVVDAAIAAWSARRIAQGVARSLPELPQEIDGRQVAIWF